MKNSLIILFLSVIITLSLPLPIEAAAVSVGIYPPIIRLKTSPGQTQQSALNITNYSDTKQTYLLRALPFDGALGSNKINYLPNTLPQKVNDLSFKDISVLDTQGKSIESLSLDPLATQQVILKVTPPASFEHKDYYFSLIALNDPLANPSAINTLLGVSSNIFISVNPLPAQAHIDEFTVPSFLSKGPVPFTIKVSNQGSSLFVSGGIITIKNILGRKVATITLPQNFILAHSSRTLTDNQTQNNTLSWNKAAPFGLYTAEITISIDGKESLKRKAYFIALPTTAIIITILVLLFIISLYLRVRKRLN